MESKSTALSIAGSDCSAGAGIQADLKTFSALGVYGETVITSVVAENTSRVLWVFDLPEEIIKSQIQAVFEDIPVGAVKIGMLKKTGIMKAVFETLKEYGAKNIVFDPVMSAKGGEVLMEQDACTYLREAVIPLCRVITPNIPEAQVLLNRKIETVEDMKNAAFDICRMGAECCLLKGGHLKGKATDILFDGESFAEFSSERINTKNTHGTGCTLSSAITAYIVKGESVKSAVEKAKKYISGAIENSLEIGRGNGPLNHFFNAKY